MQEVRVDTVPLERLRSLLDPERWERLAVHAARGRALLAGRTLWNISSTASGGGVAEMLQALLAYSRGAEVDTRWLVLDGRPDFFRFTKRLHNHLHGSGSGGDVLEADRGAYEEVLEGNLEQLRLQVRLGDVVLLHDPQTAGLAAGLRRMGAHVVWRCHVGRDTSNAQTDLAWSFLRPYVEEADAVIFSRRAYAPSWVDQDRLSLIPPSLDPLSAKNRDLDRADTEATLRRAGIVDFPRDHGSLSFVRRAGSAGSVRGHADLMAHGQSVPPGVRTVLQVSRWDRLKDMAGVLTAFADRAPDLPSDVHLVLAGPDVSGVADDPEGAEVLAECLTTWRSQRPETRGRIHLCSLPMDDVDENAHLVNALQRHATVVVQKSLAEGFGLTVTEPMWKARPVVASRVGGIQDQIVDGQSGILLDDPSDLDVFISRVSDVMQDVELAKRLGAAARERVRDRFLVDRHLTDYVELFDRLLGASTSVGVDAHTAHASRAREDPA
jgi:trehalose synthase